MKLILFWSMSKCVCVCTCMHLPMCVRCACWASAAQAEDVLRRYRTQTHPRPPTPSADRLTQTPPGPLKWNVSISTTSLEFNQADHIQELNQVQLTINMKHNDGAALWNLVGGSADIFSKVLPGNRRYIQLASVWVIVMMRRVKCCWPEWRKHRAKCTVSYVLRPHNPSIICTHNLMGDKTRRETMPQIINKADEEISLHPAADSQTRFHTTLARPIVTGTCACINIQFKLLMTDFPVSNSTMCCLAKYCSIHIL